MSDETVSWARSYSAHLDAMIYRRFDGPIPERARFAVIHDRDVPPRVKEFLAEIGEKVCGDMGDRCIKLSHGGANLQQTPDYQFVAPKAAG